MDQITTTYHTEIPDAVWRAHGTCHPDPGAITASMGGGWYVVKTREVAGRTEIVQIVDGPYLARSRAEHIAEQQGGSPAATVDQTEIPY